MNYEPELFARDRAQFESKLAGFCPAEVFDGHAHPCHPAHFPPGELDFLSGQGVLGCAEHRAAVLRYLPAKSLHGLYFGLPQKSGDRPAINSWITAELENHGTTLSRALLLVAPDDDPASVARELRSGRFCGIKVYHCYASRPDTGNALISEFAPEWLWELAHEIRGCVMLHLVRDAAISDPENQREIRYFSRRYPQARIILAHIARSFNYRHARDGLWAVADLDNVFVDTAAICESDAFRAALKVLGPQRILWGTDFPVSETRGRCVTTGDRFQWLHPDAAVAGANSGMTLVGIESLLSLREACDDAGITRGDLDAIFFHNAVRVLAPHLPRPPALRPHVSPPIPHDEKHPLAATAT